MPCGFLTEKTRNEGVAAILALFTVHHPYEYKPSCLVCKLPSLVPVLSHLLFGTRSAWIGSPRTYRLAGQQSLPPQSAQQTETRQGSAPADAGTVHCQPPPVPGWEDKEWRKVD